MSENKIGEKDKEGNPIDATEGGDNLHLSPMENKPVQRESLRKILEEKKKTRLSLEQNGDLGKNNSDNVDELKGTLTKTINSEKKYNQYNNNDPIIKRAGKTRRHARRLKLSNLFSSSGLKDGAIEKKSVKKIGENYLLQGASKDIDEFVDAEASVGLNNVNQDFSNNKPISVGKGKLLLSQALDEIQNCRELLEQTQVTRNELDEIAKVTQALQRQNIGLNKKLSNGLRALKSLPESSLNSSEEKENESGSLHEKMAHIENQYRSLVQAVVKQRDSNTQINSEIASLSKNGNNLVSAINQIKSGLSETADNCEFLSDKFNHLQAALAEKADANGAVAAKQASNHLKTLFQKTEVELKSAREELSRIRNEHSALKRNISAVSEERAKAESIGKKLAQQNKVLSEEIESRKVEIEEFVDQANLAFKETLVAQSQAQQAAKETAGSLRRVNQFKEEMTGILSQCQKLYDNSQSLRGLAEDENMQLDIEAAFKAKLDEVSNEVEVLLDDVVSHSNKIDKLEGSMKEQFDRGQNCLDEIAELAELVLSKEEKWAGEKDQVSSLLDEMKSIQSKTSELEGLVKQELDQTGVIRAQIDSVSEDARVLLSDIKEGIASEESKWGSELQGISKVIDELHESFGKVIEDQNSLRDCFEDLKRSIEEKQVETDDLLLEQTEKNSQLVQYIEDISKSQELSSLEVEKAKSVLEEIEILSQRNELVRDEISDSMQKIRNWKMGGEDALSKTEEQQRVLDNTLQELGEKQKLLSIVTKDSERMHRIISQSVNEFQQLSERVDLLIDEGKRQQEKFKDDAEDFLTKAEAHEKKLKSISDKNDKAFEVIESAQHQAENVSLESEKALQQIGQLRQDNEKILVACKKVLMHNVKLKKNLENATIKSVEYMKDTGDRIKEENKSVMSEVQMFNKRFESILGKCEESLERSSALEAKALDQKNSGQDLLSRAELLAENISQIELSTSNEEERIGSVMKEARDLSESAKSAQEEFRHTLEELSKRAEGTIGFFAEMEEVKNGLQVLLEQNKKRNIRSDKQEKILSSLIVQCRENDKRTDQLFDRCNELHKDTISKHEDHERIVAELNVISEDFRNRHIQAEDLVRSHEEKNRDIEKILDGFKNKDEIFSQIERTAKGHVEDIESLFNLNKEAQQNITEKLNIVRVLRDKVDKQSVDNQEFVRRISEQEAGLADKHRQLEALEEEVRNYYEELIAKHDEKDSRIGTLLVIGEDLSKKIEAQVAIVEKISGESDNVSMEVQRVAHQANQQLSTTKRLQGAVESALENYSDLHNKNESNLQEMYNTLNDLLRFKASSASMQVRLDQGLAQSESQREEIDEIKKNCEELLNYARSHLSKGEVQFRQIKGLEVDVRGLSENFSRITEECDQLNSKANEIISGQGSRLQQVIEMSERLEQQQAQSDRLILQQSERNDELGDVIVEQTKILEEQKQQLAETNSLNEQIANLNKAGTRTQKIVVDHIKMVRSLTREFKDRGEAVDSRQDRVEQLVHELDEKNGKLALLLGQSDDLKMAVEKSVHQCEQIGLDIDRRSEEFRKDQDSMHEMAKTTRRFEQSCYEIKSSLESELNAVRSMREEAAEWVSETETKVVNALKESHTALEAAGEREKSLTDRIIESEKRQLALQKSNKSLLDRLSSAEELFSRWESRWDNLEKKQHQQEHLLQRSQEQLEQAERFSNRLQKLLEEKEGQSKRFENNLKGLVDQSKEQQKALQNFEELVKSGREREDRLASQLEKSAALNRSLSDRLKNIEPHVEQFSAAIDKAEKSAEQAGFANKEMQVTHRELQVAFDEIRNELRSLKMRIGDEGISHPRYADGFSAPDYNDSRREPVLSSGDGGAYSEETARRAQDASTKTSPEDLEAIGLSESYVLNNQGGEEGKKKSFKSFLY